MKMYDPQMSMSFTTATKGLLNGPGENNCFLNSATQVLWHLDSFRRNFRDLQAHYCMGNSCIFCALKVIFTQFQYSDQSALPPDALRKAMANTYQDQQRFQLGFMDDAAECFENILIRIHHHLCEGSEDGCDSPHCIPHQKFAQILVEQVVCPMCGATSEPQSFSQLVQYVSTNSLVEEYKKLRRGELRGQRLTKEFFGSLLKDSTVGDPKECPGKCGHRVPVKKTLTNCPDVLSVGLIWDSDQPSHRHIEEVVLSLGSTIRIQDVYCSPSSSLLELVGVVCYYGKHYSTFLLHSKDKEWYSFDDATVRKVGPWPSVVDKCCRGHYQPLLLMYTTQSCTPIDCRSAPTQTTMMPGYSFTGAAPPTANHSRQGSSTERALRPGGQQPLEYEQEQSTSHVRQSSYIEALDTPETSKDMYQGAPPPQDGPCPYSYQYQWTNGPLQYQAGPPTSGPIQYQGGPPTNGPVLYQGGPPTSGPIQYQSSLPTNGQVYYQSGPRNSGLTQYQAGPPTNGPVQYQGGPPTSGLIQYQAGRPTNGPTQYQSGPPNSGPSYPFINQLLQNSVLSSQSQSCIGSLTTEHVTRQSRVGDRRLSDLGYMTRSQVVAGSVGDEPDAGLQVSYTVPGDASYVFASSRTSRAASRGTAKTRSASQPRTTGLSVRQCSQEDEEGPYISKQTVEKILGRRAPHKTPYVMLDLSRTQASGKPSQPAGLDMDTDSYKDSGYQSSRNSSASSSSVSTNSPAVAGPYTHKDRPISRPSVGLTVDRPSSRPSVGHMDNNRVVDRPSSRPSVGHTDNDRAVDRPSSRPSVSHMDNNQAVDRPSSRPSVGHTDNDRAVDRSSSRPNMVQAIDRPISRPNIVQTVDRPSSRAAVGPRDNIQAQDRPGSRSSLESRTSSDSVSQESVGGVMESCRSRPNGRASVEPSLTHRIYSNPATLNSRMSCSQESIAVLRDSTKPVRDLVNQLEHSETSMNHTIIDLVKANQAVTWSIDPVRANEGSSQTLDPIVQRANQLIAQCSEKERLGDEWTAMALCNQAIGVLQTIDYRSPLVDGLLRSCTAQSRALFDKCRSTNHPSSAGQSTETVYRPSQRSKFTGDYVSREEYFAHHPPPPKSTHPPPAKSTLPPPAKSTLPPPAKSTLPPPPKSTHPPPLKSMLPATPKPTPPPPPERTSSRPSVAPKPQLKSLVSVDASMDRGTSVPVGEGASVAVGGSDNMEGVNIYATLPRRPKKNKVLPQAPEDLPPPPPELLESDPDSPVTGEAPAIQDVISRQIAAVSLQEYPAPPTPTPEVRANPKIQHVRPQQLLTPPSPPGLAVQSHVNKLEAHQVALLYNSPGKTTKTLALGGQKENVDSTGGSVDLHAGLVSNFFDEPAIKQTSSALVPGCTPVTNDTDTLDGDFVLVDPSSDTSSVSGRKLKKTVTFNDRVALIMSSEEEESATKAVDYLAYVHQLMKNNPSKSCDLCVQRRVAHDRKYCPDCEVYMAKFSPATP